MLSMAAARAKTLTNSASLLAGCGARSDGMLRIPARGGEQLGRTLG